jgi:hypothetical protein
MMNKMIVFLLFNASLAFGQNLYDFEIKDGILIKYNGSNNTVTIPNNVITIAERAFSQNDKILAVNISDSVQNIESAAFYRCPNLLTLNITKSVLNIGQGAFISCEKLFNIIVDSNNKNYSSQNGILFNKNCTELIQYPSGKTDTQYDIPIGVRTISRGAFSDSNNLTVINVPNTYRNN